MKFRFLLAVFFIGAFALQVAKGNEESFIFYKDYSASIPEKSYIVFYVRSFGPDKYIILDLDGREARIYSPYKSQGLLHTHRMTDSEHQKSTLLLTSDQVRNIPERSGKVAFDAFEFSAQGIIDGKALEFHHILPENKVVLDLYELYKYFCDTIPKKEGA